MTKQIQAHSDIKDRLCFRWTLFILNTERSSGSFFHFYRDQFLLYKLILDHGFFESSLQVEVLEAGAKNLEFENFISNVLHYYRYDTEKSSSLKHRKTYNDLFLYGHIFIFVKSSGVFFALIQPKKKNKNMFHVFGRQHNSTVCIV